MIYSDKTKLLSLDIGLIGHVGLIFELKMQVKFPNSKTTDSKRKEKTKSYFHYDFLLLFWSGHLICNQRYWCVPLGEGYRACSNAWECSWRSVLFWAAQQSNSQIWTKDSWIELYPGVYFFPKYRLGENIFFPREEFIGKNGGKGKKGRKKEKRGGKREEKKEIVVKKRDNILIYLVSLWPPKKVS